MKVDVGGRADGNPAAYAEQEFTVYATVGYVDPLPADYSRIP